MSGWRRALLVWLVAFALPLQGYAAAVLAGCAQRHAALAATAVAAVHEGGHDHGAHGHAAPAPAVDGNVAPDAGAAGSPADCSVCAPCCAAAAPAGAMQPRLDAPARDAPALLPSPSLPDAVVDVPERPPRGGG